MSNNSVVFTGLDFDSGKQALKNYLKSQDIFKDYNFDGSNIDVLLDLLAFNGFKQAFYQNMIFNEAFLDSAQLRGSVVSKAKTLNYLPISFRSAVAYIDITIPVTNESKATLSMPKGTSFIGRVGPESYSFVTDSNLVIGRSGNNYVASNVAIYEGDILLEQFSYDQGNFILNNETIDTRSITVTVVEDNGATYHTYTQAQSLFGLDETSKVFFLQGYNDYQYEIVFGDGVTGRAPKAGSTILVENRVCNGELPNGISTFRATGTINGETVGSITTVAVASGGAVAEEISSIKFNAPRHFRTQERAVTNSDYETLLKTEFPEINVVSAYGGEEADPPQYGKVLVSVDLKNADGLPTSKEIEYKRFLKSRATLSIDPVFIDPEYTYISVRTNINYNINATTLSSEDIKTLVTSAILQYNIDHLDDFKTTLRFSQMSKSIDASHSSILSNETSVYIIKKLVPVVGSSKTYNLNFSQPLTVSDGTVYSETFTYNNQICEIANVGTTLNLYGVSGSQLILIKSIGSVDAVTGSLTMTNLKIDSSSSIKFYAEPVSKDIYTSKNDILSIKEEDITIVTTQIRE